MNGILINKEELVVEVRINENWGGKKLLHFRICKRVKEMDFKGFRKRMGQGGEDEGTCAGKQSRESVTRTGGG